MRPLLIHINTQISNLLASSQHGKKAMTNCRQ